MKDKYKKSISLRCITCGDASLEFNEDESWVKCKRCGREYSGGYDELVTLNQSEISVQLNEMKEEVSKDLKKDMTKMLKDAFKGNKNIKFR